MGDGYIVYENEVISDEGAIFDQESAIKRESKFRYLSIYETRKYVNIELNMTESLKKKKTDQLSFFPLNISGSL